MKKALRWIKINKTVQLPIESVEKRRTKNRHEPLEKSYNPLEAFAHTLKALKKPLELLEKPLATPWLISRLFFLFN